LESKAIKQDRAESGGVWGKHGPIRFKMEWFGFVRFQVLIPYVAFVTLFPASLVGGCADVPGHLSQLFPGHRTAEEHVDVWLASDD
jgi:hypothetical protein